MAAFTLPSSPLGKFVRAHYSAGARRAAFTKLSKSGFTVPGARATTPKAPASARMLPPELIGVPGVRGPFFNITPRLNPNDYRFVTNDQGRVFGAPRTELDDLDFGGRQLVKAYDAQSAAQRPVIQGAYSDLQGALNQNADATKNRLASLGSLIQGQAPLAGAVQGVPGADAQLADARRQEQGANAAVTVGQMSALPAIAATEGTKALTGWDAERSTGHTGLIGELRGQAAEAAVNQQKALSDQRSLAAQLRGQDLQLLGTQIGQQGGLQRALISADTSRGNKQAELENRLLIAEMTGDVSTANNIRTQLAKIQGASISAGARVTAAAQRDAGKAGQQRAKATAAVVKDVRSRLTGTYVRNPQWTRTSPPSVPQYVAKPGTQVSPEDLLADAATQGVKIVPVLQAIRAVIGPGWARDLPTANALYKVLQDYMKPAQVRKIIVQFTGYDPSANV
jgi:hypothetical protein